MNNAGGSSDYQMAGGVPRPGRFGFRIREDLGGESAVIAALENGFDNPNGKLGQGGRLFGRQARIGLTSPHWQRTPRDGSTTRLPQPVLPSKKHAVRRAG